MIMSRYMGIIKKKARARASERTNNNVTAAILACMVRYGFAPKFKHSTRDGAEIEAARLARENPGRKVCIELGRAYIGYKGCGNWIFDEARFSIK